MTAIAPTAPAGSPSPAPAATSAPDGSSLRRRILRAGSWTLVSHLFSQALRFGANLLLARLLVPEAFGLMAVVHILMLGLALFSDIGITQNIVQSPRGAEPAFLNTAWVAQILRGVLIWACSLLLALGLHFAGIAGLAPAGSVYADPLLPWVVAAFSFTAVLQGLESTRSCLARRNLELAAIARMEIFSQVVATAVMLAWAWVAPSIWVLVGGGLASAVARVGWSHLALAGPANRWQWNRDDFRDILGFGKWVFLSSIFGFLVINGDRLLLGGLVDAEMLGLYAIAFLIVNTVQVLLSQLMASVAFPALSQVAREAPQRLGEVYYKLRLPMDAAWLLVAGGLYSLGPTLIGLLYDPRYADAGHMLSVLALGGVAARYQLIDQCCLALGNPRLLSLANGLRLAALYVLLPVLFLRFGMEGALWAIVVAPWASLPPLLHFAARHGLFSLAREGAMLPLLPAGWALGEAVRRFLLPALGL